jgi:hypothetical protein
MSQSVFPPKRYDLQLLAVELAEFNPTGGYISDDGYLVVEFADEPTVEQHLAINQIVEGHAPAEFAHLDLLVAKAVNVWAGTDTFTVAQSQKILAGLVLIVARHLR